MIYEEAPAVLKVQDAQLQDAGLIGAEMVDAEKEDVPGYIPTIC